jgi:hypothetical protein
LRIADDLVGMAFAMLSRGSKIIPTNLIFF